MISNHYPVLYGHRLAPLLLFLLLALAAYARHFFNLRHRGVLRPRILLLAALGFGAIVAGVARDEVQRRAQPGAALPDDGAALALVREHCAVCHAAAPTWPGMSAAPQGLRLDTPAAVDRAAARSVTAVASGYMPLANVTGLGDEERTALVAWLGSR
jgi:uncharacterized membrane protein